MKLIRADISDVKRKTAGESLTSGNGTAAIGGDSGRVDGMTHLGRMSVDRLCRLAVTVDAANRMSRGVSIGQGAFRERRDHFLP